MELTSKDRRVVTLVWLGSIIVLWEVLAAVLLFFIQDNMASSKLPFPHDVLITFVGEWSSLLTAGFVTLSRAGLGFAIGGLIGVTLAVVMSLSKIAEKIAFPYLIVSQMIPVLGLAPIIFNIVRDMNMSRIVIAAYITFFPVAVNMLSGFKSVEDEKKELMRSIAASRVDIYLKLMFPYSLPYLFTGLKIAAPMAVTASILVDMLGSKSGIGVRILYSLYSSSFDIFWASVFTSAFMGILSYNIVIFAERLFIPWKNVASKKVGAK
jgi:NitT/TauT family transport system permease protein